jgi:hypothetical protein
MDGPDPAAITAYVVETFEGVDIVTAGGGTFCSCDAEKHWPNFATLVTTDEFDQFSNLDRPGVFRLNFGLSPAGYRVAVGNKGNPDFSEFDRILPHPVYARQRWVSVLNPTWATFETVVKPLLDEAYDLVATRLEGRRTRSTPKLD